jgi:hypothetical protein
VVARKSWQAARREGSISRWSCDECKNLVKAGSYIFRTLVWVIWRIVSRAGDVGTGGGDGTGVESRVNSERGSDCSRFVGVGWIPKTPQQLLDYVRAQCHSVRAFKLIRILFNPSCGWFEAFAKLDVGCSFGNLRTVTFRALPVLSHSTYDATYQRSLRLRFLLHRTQNTRVIWELRTDVHMCIIWLTSFIYFYTGLEFWRMAPSVEIVRVCL